MPTPIDTANPGAWKSRLPYDVDRAEIEVTAAEMAGLIPLLPSRKAFDQADYLMAADRLEQAGLDAAAGCFRYYASWRFGQASV